MPAKKATRYRCAKNRARGSNHHVVAPVAQFTAAIAHRRTAAAEPAGAVLSRRRTAVPPRCAMSEPEYMHGVPTGACREEPPDAKLRARHGSRAAR